MTANPSIVRYPAAFDTITPAATSAAAKITFVSHSVETAPNAVTLIVQTAGPVAKRTGRGSRLYGISVDYQGYGTSEIDNAGPIAAAMGSGIELVYNNDGDVTVENSYIGKAERIDFDQTAGTISDRAGVYAEVSRASAMGDTRSTDSDGNYGPAIDVDWTGEASRARHSRSLRAKSGRCDSLGQCSAAAWTVRAGRVS